MTPQPGDILLFYNAQGLSRLITWFTKSCFYHVGLYEGDGRSIEARPRGVVRRDLQSEGETDFLVVPAPHGAGQRALEWAQQQVGDGYDVRGVAGIVIDRLFDQLHVSCANGDGSFSCGELVLRAYEEAGVTLLPGITADKVVPADFARLVPVKEYL